MRTGERRMLETRKSLIRKAHHKEANPAEYLGMTMGINLVQAGGGKAPAESDLQQKVGAQTAPSVSTTKIPARKNGR